MTRGQVWPVSGASRPRDQLNAVKHKILFAISEPFAELLRFHTTTRHQQRRGILEHFKLDARSCLRYPKLGDANQRTPPNRPENFVRRRAIERPEAALS